MKSVDTLALALFDDASAGEVELHVGQIDERDCRAHARDLDREPSRTTADVQNAHARPHMLREHLAMHCELDAAGQRLVESVPFALSVRVEERTERVGIVAHPTIKATALRSR